jgi:hypothetical protein
MALARSELPLLTAISFLQSIIEIAAEQARKSAESSSKLAQSLNRITLALMVVGVIQVVVTVVLAWHH